MSEISTIGLDLAKNVYQLHGVDSSGQVVLKRQLRRAQVEKFFSGLAPCLVGIEACGSAHHWARVISRYGHEVRLMPPAYVKPYVRRNKNDGRDAEGCCEAVTRPTMRFVPVKSVAQQAMLAVHSTRALLTRQRTMVANALRAALSEIGIVAAQGYEGLRELLAKLEEPSEEIPELMRTALLMLAQHWRTLDADERVLEQQIAKAARCDKEARRLMEVPGVGPIIASTVLAKVPDAKVFRSGRDFAAWIGLRQGPRNRRPAPSGADLQAGGSDAAKLVDHGGQRPPATANSSWHHRSMAERSAGAAALQGRHGRLGRQERPHSLGDAGQGRTLPRPRERAGCCLAEGRQPPRSRSSDRKGHTRCDGKWSGNRDRKTPYRHRASQRVGMIGIRSAISIRARGQRPLLEAVYMTAPRFICRNT